ncbi:restriction endonuclease subunit S [Candidatus Bathyarchaeota archaeon]|nr:restriction endonuclease subunit S [Candidatus Bathyarchaeota archaeon]
MVSDSITPFHWNVIKSEWICSEPSQRLDANFYAKDIVEARILLNRMKEKGVKLKTLNDPSFVSQIFWPARFKRKYAADENGRPFLTPKEIFQFLIKPSKFIVDPPENLLIKEKWILVTRSGSIGRCLIANTILSNYVVSDDLIRIILNDEKYLGYIYAFLNTWIGQAFLTKTPYGETVKHIEPEHIANIPLPLLSESDLKEINEKILEAYKLREEAQKLLLEAEKIFRKELELPLLHDNSIDYFGGENGKLIKAFTLNSDEFFTSQIRLNAYSYMPISRYTRKTLNERKGKYNLKKLGDPEVSRKVFTPPRFKRIYVKNEKEGIPLLQGSHIPMLKYFDIKLIWNKMENLNEYIIKRNWILVTCSGTIGRVFLVSKLCEGWAATNHMTRIIPSEKINAGYLTIFLQSPYGLSQLQTLIYGGVVEELGEAGELLSEILVPIPSDTAQEKIGNLVIEAYEKKDQANMLENKAVKALEEKLVEAAK